MLGTFKEEFSKIKNRYESGVDLEAKAALKDQLMSRPLVLFGLGFYGAVAVNNFAAHGISVDCFCDSFKTGADPETGIPIISPSALCEKYSQANIVISAAAPKNQKSIYEQILSLGFDRKQVFFFDAAYKFFNSSRVEVVSLTLDEMNMHLEGYERVYNFFEDDGSKKIILDRIKGYLFNEIYEYDNPEEMYFPQEIVLSEDEVFIDAGLYIGDTTEAFIKRTNGKYRQIIGFDIDEHNLSSARENLKSYNNIEIIPKGLWSISVEKNAELGLLAGSNINENALGTVSLISIDELFASRAIADYPTFIKMDIEGSEKEALLGAEKVIKAAVPKLAVCVYHKPEDIYVLPELIYGFNAKYRFMLRHYSPYTWETALYAY